VEITIATKLVLEAYSALDACLDPLYDPYTPLHAKTDLRKSDNWKREKDDEMGIRIDCQCETLQRRTPP
jgi:hypothetical protein